MSRNKKHYCYLLQSEKNGRTYIGYTTDPIRRLKEHNSIDKGAKYTRKFGQPWKLVFYIEGFISKTQALQCEYAMKHNSTIEKEVRCHLNSSNTFDRKIAKIFTVLRKDKFTEKSVNTRDYIYNIIWYAHTVPIVNDVVQKYKELLPHCTFSIITTNN